VLIIGKNYLILLLALALFALPSLVRAAGPTVSLSLSTNTLDSGQSVLFTGNIIGGTPPYTVSFFNATGGKPAEIIGYNGFVVAGNYPIVNYDGRQQNGCNLFGNNIICVTGSTNTYYGINAVYYAPILSDGLLGTWTASNSYGGGAAFDNACVLYSNSVTSVNNIYCFGGGSSSSNQIYYAPVLTGGSGVGTWATSANAYPSNGGQAGVGGTNYQTCTTYANDIYCIDGQLTNPAGTVYYTTNAVYYAPIFANGAIGTWSTVANSYPANVDDMYCLTYSNNIYCNGGYAAGPSGSGYASSSYYASIISPGVLGAWQVTNNIAGVVTQHISCITNSNIIYCNPWEGGGSILPSYYAPIFSSGAVGAFSLAQQATNLKSNNNNDQGSCVVYSNSIYCFTDWNSINPSSATAANNIGFAPLSQSGAIANTLSYGFKTSSATSGNFFIFKMIATDSESPPVTANSVPSIFMVDPEPTITLSASTLTIINMGQGVTFINTTTRGTPPYIYSYNVIGGNDFTINGNTITFNAAGNYIVTENVTDGTGGKGTSGQVMVTVNLPSAIPTATFVALPSIIDLGQSSILTITPTTANNTLLFSITATPGCIFTPWYGTEIQYDGPQLQRCIATPLTTGLHTYVANVEYGPNQITIIPEPIATVFVNSQPTITLSASTPTTINAGQTVTFTNTTALGTPPYAYFYTVLGANAIVNYTLDSNNIITFLKPGTYSVVENVTDSVGGKGSSEVTVKVNPPTPLPAPSITFVASPLITDLGQSTALTLSIVGTGNAIFFTVYPPPVCGINTGYSVFVNSIVFTNTLCTITPPTSGLYAYSANVAYDNNTQNLTATASFIVNPALSLPSVSAIPNTIDLGVGDNVILTATASGGSGAYIYTWYQGSTCTGTPLSSTLVTPTITTLTYCVSATDGISTVTGTTKIIAHSPPTIAIASPLSSNIDVGQSLTFTNFTEFGTPPYTYFYNVIGGNDFTISGNTITFNAVGNYIVTENVIDSDGGNSISNNALVSVNSAPSVTALGTTSADVGQLITLSATPGFASYQWYNDTSGTPVVIAGETTDAYVATAGATGTFKYYVTVTDSNGGTGTSAIASVTVSNVPIVSVTGTTSADIGQPITLTATVTSPLLVSYRWYNDSGATPVAIAGAITDVYASTAGATGTFKYYVVVTDSNGNTIISIPDSQVVVSAVPVGLGPAPVNLGTADNFAILAKTGITTTGTTSVVGNIGVSPISSTAITGFGLILDPSGQFSTSTLVTGKVYAADYSVPTPAMMTAAVSDMQAAYTDAAGRTNPSNTDLGAGNIAGLTLSPGLYKWSTGVTIPTSVTLDCAGNANSVFIFQIAQNLDLGNGAAVTLSGGCQPQNIFWQVAGQATLGTTSNFEGIILSKTQIVIGTGATLNGRALAQTQVTLDASTVTAPTGGQPSTNSSIGISVTANTVDVGQPITLNATSGLTSYQWYNDTTGTPVVITNAITDTYTSTAGATGTFIYYVVGTNSTGATETSGTASVTVNPQPTITLSASTPTTINAKHGVTFTNTTTPGTPPYAYSYGVIGGNDFTISGNTITFNAAGNYIVTENVVDSVGGNSISNNELITVNPEFIVLISIASPTIVSGSNTTFTANAVNGSSPYTYQWYNGTLCDNANAITGANTAAYSTPTLTSTTSYCVVATDSLGANAMSNATVTVTAPVTTPSGGGGGGSTSAGGVAFVPTISPYTNGTESGHLITNLTVGNSETFLLSNRTTQLTVNFITPTTAGVTVNNQAYTLTLDNTTVLSNTSNSTDFVVLENLNYVPIVHTINLLFYETITPVFTPPTTTNSTVTKNVTSQSQPTNTTTLFTTTIPTTTIIVTTFAPPSTSSGKWYLVALIIIIALILLAIAAALARRRSKPKKKANTANTNQ
jgi:uncharacterized membrane protein SirB2